MSSFVLSSLAALLLAACGSSSTKTISSSTTTTSKSALIAALSKRPTQIPIKTPINKSIPKGKNIVYIASPDDVYDPPNIKAAAKLLGWHVKVITPDASDTATAIQAAFHEAVEDKPDGIIYNATPAALVSRELEQAKEEGIPVVGVAISEPLGTVPGVIAAPGNINYTKKEEGEGGRLMGLIAKPHTGIAFVEETGYTPVAKIEAAVKAAAMKACPTCTYYLEQIDVTQAAQAPSIIADYLRSHPSIKTIFGVYYPAFGVGLQAQLSAEGVTGVKVLMSALDPEGLDAVRSGDPFVAGSLYPFAENDYMAIDALARKFVGENPAIDNTPATPYWFVSADAPAKFSASAIGVASVASQFARLWGK